MAVIWGSDNVERCSQNPGQVCRGAYDCNACGVGVDRRELADGREAVSAPETNYANLIGGKNYRDMGE